MMICQKTCLCVTPSIAMSLCATTLEPTGCLFERINRLCAALRKSLNLNEFSHYSGCHVRPFSHSVCSYHVDFHLEWLCALRAGLWRRGVVVAIFAAGEGRPAGFLAHHCGASIGVFISDHLDEQSRQP